MDEPDDPENMDAQIRRMDHHIDMLLATIFSALVTSLEAGDMEKSLHLLRGLRDFYRKMADK